MKKLLIALLLAAHARPAAALELLLEDNKGESGTIGYVNIDRVFKEFSGTAGAREEFISEIKKKEAQVEALKGGVFALKADISRLRQEREFALALPGLFDGEKPAAKPAEPAAPAEPQAQPASTASVAGLPGMEGSAPAQPPAEPPAQKPAEPAPAQKTAADTISMPGIGNIPLSRFKFSVSTSVPEIDAAIASKESQLKKSEDNLRMFQKQAERELIEYESRKTEVLLGRIYIALRELAQKESVSVVIDKRNILYGQPAVDLTEKLIEKLEAPDL